MKDYTRRQKIDLNTPAELAIRKAIEEVEKLPANEILTDVVVKLEEVRNLVADYVDNEPRKHKFYHCKECGFTFLLADNATLTDIENFKSFAIYHTNPKLNIPCRQQLNEITEKEFLIIRNGK